MLPGLPPKKRVVFLMFIAYKHTYHLFIEQEEGMI